MSKVWIIDGIEPAAGQPRRAHATEDGAYAALGRYVAEAGYWSSDWAVVELEVVGGPAVERSTRPGWLDASLPGPWVGREDEEHQGEVQCVTGRVIARLCVTGLSSQHDVELAEYLAALVNADR